ncbi:Serine carboxypeptidase-like 18 [Hordeum vulgare]|nr:Serine carboxypeptidase-like 18 [Hordeum vulgare]
MTLVRSIITFQAVYSMTPLIIPQGSLNNLNKIEWAFLWSGLDKTTGAKCKVNSDIVCRPPSYGGLGVLNTDKFARALRLGWLWYEWKEPSKLRVGLGNPCTKEDHDFFYASTTIVMGNGAKTLFWDSPWLLGRKPKEIAPHIFRPQGERTGRCARRSRRMLGCSESEETPSS